MAKTIGLRKDGIKKVKVPVSAGRGRAGAKNALRRASKLKEKNVNDGEDQAVSFSEKVWEEDCSERV